MDVLCTWVKLTDLQILGCELHLVAGLRQDPLGGAIVLSQTP